MQSSLIRKRRETHKIIPVPENPVTDGTNQLCMIEALSPKIEEILNGHKQRKPVIDLWDGKTSERVSKSIAEILL